VVIPINGQVIMNQGITATVATASASNCPSPSFAVATLSSSAGPSRAEQGLLKDSSRIVAASSLPELIGAEAPELAVYVPGLPRGASLLPQPGELVVDSLDMNGDFVEDKLHPGAHRCVSAQLGTR
jgi:hypothetical protein